MTLLGQFCLWIAILVGTWGAIVGFSGRWQGRPALAEAVIRSVYAVFGLMVVATICLWQGLISHDFNIEYVAGYTSRTCRPISSSRPCGRVRRVRCCSGR
jgi:Cytochrome c biogenesis factor